MGSRLRQVTKYLMCLPNEFGLCLVCKTVFSVHAWRPLPLPFPNTFQAVCLSVGFPGLGRLRKSNKKKKLSQSTKGIAKKRSRGLDWTLMKWPEALLSLFKLAIGVASHRNHLTLRCCWLALTEDGKRALQ
ncbi:hypothetical protein ACRRTK_019526 [Alexandromys fortis]